MAEVSEIFSELVKRYEDGIASKKAKLAEYRRRAEEYTSFLEKEILDDQGRLERLQAELIAIKATEASRPPLPDATPLQAASRPPKSADAPSTGVQQRSGSQSDLIRRMARDILAREGRPLMQSQLKMKMQEMGIEIASTDPKELIRAALKGRPEFRHIGGEGWTLAEP